MTCPHQQHSPFRSSPRSMHLHTRPTRSFRVHDRYSLFQFFFFLITDYIYKIKRSVFSNLFHHIDQANRSTKLIRNRRARKNKTSSVPLGKDAHSSLLTPETPAACCFCPKNRAFRYLELADSKTTREQLDRTRLMLPTRSTLQLSLRRSAATIRRRNYE